MRKLLSGLRVVLPYAVTGARRRRLRSLILAGSVAAAVTIYLLFAGYVGAHRGVAVDAVEPVSLPVGAIVLYRDVAPLDQLRASVHVRRVVPAMMIEAGGPWGQRPLVGIEGDDPVWQNLTLTSGRLPGPGEVLVPDGDGFPDPTTVARLLYVAGPASTSGDLLVTGTYLSEGMPAPWPLTTYETLAAMGVPGPNMAWLELADSRRAADGVRRIGSPLWVITQDLGARHASQVVSGIYGPHRTVMAMVFVLSGLGVLNIMLLGFLERRKSLGILKACGLESPELMLLLLSEAAATALFGLAAGIGIGLVLSHQLRERAGLELLLTPSDVVVAGAAAMLVAIAGAYLPARLGQRATVLDLVSGR